MTKSSYVPDPKTDVLANINLKQGDNSAADHLVRSKNLLSKLNRNPLNQADYLYNLKIVLDLFGYPDLRPNQRDAVAHLFSGEDLLFVSATGSGKSCVYISAALSMGLKTIIFSPLISLIQNQSDILRQNGLKVGVISSSVTPKERSLFLNLWSHGELDFLFVAPERLDNENFMDIMLSSPPDFVVVDEIHCASQYGDNFRAAYKKIAPFIETVKPRLFLGLTATLSKEVEDDIRKIFNMPDIKKLCKAYSRENLHFTSIANLSEAQADAIMFRELNKADNNGNLVPTIVYCSSVALVERLYLIYGKSIKGGAMMYHGQMRSQERETNQINFINNNIRVVFATNAFGMGVDKPNVGKVIFRTLPGTIEELIQGFGRGGRNGCACDCILLGDMSSVDLQNYFIDMGYPPKASIVKFYNALCKLKDENDGLVYAKLKDICEHAGIQYQYSNAIIQILTGYNVIRRTSNKSMAKIRIKDAPDTKDKITEKFESYINKIEIYGIEDNGFISFDLEFLSSEIGLSKATVIKTLKNFNELGYLEYIAPSSVPPIEVIGDISRVDFEHLSKKRLEKLTKLSEVISYISINDNKKAKYLEDYFERVNNESR